MAAKRFAASPHERCARQGEAFRRRVMTCLCECGIYHSRSTMHSKCETVRFEIRFRKQGGRDMIAARAQILHP